MMYTDLLIKTYLAGYSKEGESCVFLLYSTKPSYMVHYSIVIDSYSEEKKNKTLDILKCELKKQKLDMLVWTHPHKDHYVGLTDIIKKHCDKHTKIITPAIGNNLERYDDGVKEVMSYINSLVHNRCIPDRYDVGQIADVCKTYIDKELRNIPLIQGIRFEIISPFSALGYCNADMKTMNYNWMSIGMVIQLYAKDGAHYFLYTGDMDKDTISMLLYKIKCGDINIPQRYEYIKIPHHGSRASEGLLDILSGEEKSELAAVTVFTPQCLPDVEMLGRYKEKAISVLRTDEAEGGIIEKEYVLVG